MQILHLWKRLEARGTDCFQYYGGASSRAAWHSFGHQSHLPNPLAWLSTPPHKCRNFPLTIGVSLSWQDARWRRGESVSLKAARDSMVSLELAQHAQMVYSAP